jgi:hypothetical protein
VGGAEEYFMVRPSALLVLVAFGSFACSSGSTTAAPGSPADAGGERAEAAIADSDVPEHAAQDVVQEAVVDAAADVQESGGDAGSCGAVCDLGQTLEGAGRANFDWFKLGAKADVAFIANRSGAIQQLAIPWRYDGAYGAGTFGTYNFELQGNGAGDLPSGNTLASAPGISPDAVMDGKTDGLVHLPISAVLTQGQLYHLVVTPTNANLSQNWSSLNTMMSPVLPWDGARAYGPRLVVFDGNTWAPWSSKSNPWNTQGSNQVNGSHIALRITWADNAISGSPYQSAAMTDPGVIQASSRVGQQIVWTASDAVIRSIGLAVRKEGHPSALLYHLEQSGVEVATGTLAQAAQVGLQEPPTWVRAVLPSPVTLKQGTSYRLWFESPESSGPDQYLVHPVYGPSDDAPWLETGWGGTASCLIVSSGGAWTQRKTHDLSFSMRTDE